MIYICAQCSDFVNEKSEIEGFEYACGLIIRRKFYDLQLKNQNKVGTFRVSMKEAFQHVLTIVTRQLSRQAQSYMLGFDENSFKLNQRSQKKEYRKRLRTTMNLYRKGEYNWILNQ